MLVEKVKKAVCSDCRETPRSRPGRSLISEGDAATLPEVCITWEETIAFYQGSGHELRIN